MFVLVLVLVLATAPVPAPATVPALLVAGGTGVPLDHAVHSYELSCCLTLSLHARQMTPWSGVP